MSLHCEDCKESDQRFAKANGQIADNFLEIQSLKSRLNIAVEAMKIVRGRSHIIDEAMKRMEEKA